MLTSQELTASGAWTEDEANLHITVVEMRANIHALCAFQECPVGLTYALMSDNTVVAAYTSKHCFCLLSLLVMDFQA